MAKSVYIHIPFCKQKCKYCSFVSFPCLEKIDDYFNALIKEIKYFYKGEVLDTLYFGGGTPSLVDLKYLEKIISIFNLNKNCETTLELNPDDANLKYLKDLSVIGVNRLSIGAQNFDDNVLKLIGRRHNSNQIFDAVNLAKEAGFNNISLDLIYGLPEQDLKKDVEILTNFDIQHISTYGLKIEEDSYWGKFYPENLPDEDAQAEMYLFINQFFDKKGFKRYEISNFAKEGFESKHNLNYWNNQNYYGFGIAAHGYIDNIRYSNSITFEKYLLNPLEKESNHIVTSSEKLEEEIFLGFRKESGIDVNKINEIYNIDFEKKYKRVLNKYMPDYIQKTENVYKLTLQGVLLSNNILCEFL